MKTLSIAAAAALLITGFTPAMAQTRVVERTVTTSHVETHTRGNHGWRNKRVCNVRWSHHRKIRTCRTIRVRR